MSAGLALNELNAARAPETPGPVAYPSSFFERMQAGFNAEFTEDRYGNQLRAHQKYTNKIIADVKALTDIQLDNPYDLQPTQAEIAANLGQPIPAIMGKRMEKLKKVTAELRGTYSDFMGQMPDEFLNVDAVPRQIAESSRAAREYADSLVGTGGGFGNVLGAMGGAMLQPHNILGLPLLGATALPRAAATATIGTWASNVLKEGAFQALAQGALQVPGTILDYSARKDVGTEQTLKEMLGEVAMAAGGGFVLGSGVRTIHAALTKLKLAGVRLPPEIEDARIANEGDAIYSDSNALGMHPADLEKQVDRGVNDVLVGQFPRYAANDLPDLVIPPREPRPAIEGPLSQEPDVGFRSLFDPALTSGPQINEKGQGAFFIGKDGRIYNVSIEGHDSFLTRTGTDANDMARVSTYIDPQTGAHEFGIHVQENLSAAQELVVRSIRVELRKLERQGEQANLSITRSSDDLVAKPVEVSEEGPLISTGEERIDPAAKAQLDKVEKMVDEIPPAKPAVNRPEPTGAGRPEVEGITPEQLATVEAARKQADSGILENGSSLKQQLELLDADEAGLARLAKHCGLKVP